MKKLFLFIAIVAIFHTSAFPQGCLPKGITFTTQAQIDSFQINYPGCTGIVGDLTIDGNEITDLNGLSMLTSIEGNLKISNNEVLTSLEGLENVTSIGGDLTIYYNAVLTSLAGLEGVTSIGGNLIIGDENGLGNPALASLTGLDNLNSIVGDLIIGGYLGNASLISLTGLEGLTSIGGDITIYNN